MGLIWAATNCRVHLRLKRQPQVVTYICVGRDIWRLMVHRQRNQSMMATSNQQVFKGVEL